MSALAVSQIEKHFQTNEIYKRSKRYFDVIKLKSIEQNNSKERRKPQLHKSEVQKNIKLSFMSSNDFYQKRREQEIEKSKKKNLSFQFIDDKEQTQTNYSVVTKHNFSIANKSFDMGKALSRQFFESLQTYTSPSVQDPFDNFVISDFSKGDKGKSVDFNKLLGRKDNLAPSQNKNYINFSKKKNTHLIQNPQQTSFSMTEPINISNSLAPSVDVNKTYQKVVFDQSRFRCLIDVQKQKKAIHRKSLQTSLKQHPQPKQLNLQSIEKGRAFSQKKQKPTNLMFYHGKGMQQPSQIHMKTLKKNENYWVEQLKIMKRQDFETVKRREEMIQKRNDENKMKKTVIDVRGEICDAKFFLRNKI